MPMSTPTPSGDRVRALRGRLGLSQAGLARTAGVSPTTVNTMETGVRHVRPATVRRIARALGVSPAELFDADEVAAAPKAPSPRERLVEPSAGGDEYPGLAERFAEYEARARQIAAGDDLPLAAPSVALEAEEDARRMDREGVLPDSVVREYLFKASEITRIVMGALDARKRDLVREIAAINEAEDRLSGIARDEGRARSAS